MVENLPSKSLNEQLLCLTDQPGVYLFKDDRSCVLYVGKALNLRKRVLSYFAWPKIAHHGHKVPAFLKSTPPEPSTRLSPRVERMIRQVCQLEVRLAQSEGEALLLEVELIKQLQPKYNVAFRDDKTYPILKVTNEPFPRLVVVRRKHSDGGYYFGPYPNAGLMHAAVQFMRKVFPLRTCKTFPKTPCLEYHLGQCLAPCVGHVNAEQYQKIVKDLEAFLRGEKDLLLRDLTRRMHSLAQRSHFEEAARLRDQIQALTSIIVAKEKSSTAGPLEQLQAALKLPQRPRRIEAFDISNIFGSFAVGAMVVFTDGKPYKTHYRRFRIKTVKGIDDYQMMREVIKRRYSGTLSRELPFPDLILVDGGKGQLSAACEELGTLSLSIPAIGLAKRLEHIFVPNVPEPIVLLSTSPVLHLLQHIRDEAHRFAIAYHRQLRRKITIQSLLSIIAGIGPKRRAALLAHFGSITHIAQADPSEIATVAHINQAAAEHILERLRNRHP